MINALRDLPKILKQLKKSGFVLLLDFDGTLSDIVPDHRKAVLSRAAKDALRKLSRHAPVGIISGRSLADIRRRVGLRDVAYTGCHGLETMLAGGRHERFLNSKEEREFKKVATVFKKIRNDFPGISLEDKGLGFALHYRSLARAKRKGFRKTAERAASPFLRDQRIRVIDSLFVFDVLPNSSRTKGDPVREFYTSLRNSKRAVPIYIGDSKTDEDAFRELKDGITIRVGKSPRSAAKYYLKKRGEVDKLLKELGKLN